MFFFFSEQRIITHEYNNAYDTAKNTLVKFETYLLRSIAAAIYNYPFARLLIVVLKVELITETQSPRYDLSPSV